MKNIILLLCTALFSSLLLAQEDMVEKELSINSKGSALQGTLLAANAHQPVVIIIAGSGPTDRNGNNTAGISCDAYKLLAIALAKNNIASYRYDKRGIAKSAIKGFKEKDILFDDYINDAIAIYQFLSDSLGFNRIYFAGHSEGSLIGMIASQRTKANGYISIAGAGRPIDVIITEQVTKQSPIIAKQVDSLLQVLKSTHKIDSVPPYLLSLFRPSIQPYMLSWMKYDPAMEIKKLSCPILLLQGSCDIQVSVRDAESLYAANKKASLNIIDGMTHVLKDAELNCKDNNLKTYHDPTLPLNIKLVESIVGFITTTATHN